VVNKLHRFIALSLAILALAAPYTTFGGPPVPGEKHPVAQLVEWELTANNAMSHDALARMADAVLKNVDTATFPPNLLPFSLKAFRERDLEAQKSLIGALTDRELKLIVQIPAPLQYFEIPQDQIAALGNYSPHELQSELGQKAKELVYFEKNGVPYVRWFLHPLASPDRSEIANAIEAKFKYKPAPISGEYKFNFTSSRSMIVFKKSYDDAISLKVSLPAAEGPFKNKQIHLKEYSAWTRLNSYMDDTLPETSTESMIMLNEPLGLGAGTPGREDAFLFRDLHELPGKKRYYLPAFSVLDSETGAAIAKLNGSNDPLKFWEKNLLEPMANGFAELRAKTGAEHTSPHSQNLMVELDEHMKPTGRIVLRDFDFYLDESAYDKFNRVVTNKEGLIDRRFGDKVAKIQRHGFSLRNGLANLPSWMTEKDYGQWVKKYFDAFANKYSEITGIPKAHIDTGILKYVQYGGFTPVQGDDFIQGKSGNFHVIDIQGKPGFSEEYAAWLTKRQQQIKAIPVKKIAAQKIPAAADPKNAQIPPAAEQKAEQLLPFKKITNWEDASLAFNNKLLELNGFENSSESLITELVGFDLKKRKEINKQIVEADLPSRISRTRNPQAALEMLKVLEAAEPAIISYQLKDAVKLLEDIGAGPEQLATAKKIVANANFYVNLINKLKNGSRQEAEEAAEQLEKEYPVLRQSLADAFAYRLNRAEDMVLINTLGMKMAKLGAGDPIAENYLLTQGIKKLPYDYQKKIKAVMEAKPNNCAVDFAAIN
jgi:hypothetical protein